MKISINLHPELYVVIKRSFNRIRFLIPVFALFLSFPIKSYSRNFYFSSSSGNDSYTSEQAKNPATPWKTIDKLNNSMSLINPGDSILFKRGDVFTGQITLLRSGNAGAKIVFSAYGSGNLPMIKGTLPVTGWTRYNGNIWQADCPQIGIRLTNFIVNGKSQQVGRYPNEDAPNKGYLNIDSHIGTSSITSSSLLSMPNWTGGEAVVRTRRWKLDRIFIQTHVGNSLYFIDTTFQEVRDNYGFFIQNHLSTLDKNGEWYHDVNNKKLYLFFLNDPNSITTEASAYSSTFTSTGQKYFVIKNIYFKGSVNTTIRIIGSDNIEITDIITSESGTDAVYFLDCKNLSFTNNRILNTNNNAVKFSLCEKVLISKNTIRHTAIRPGMGLSSNQQYLGLYITGTNTICESNLIDSVGYIGIHFEGDSITIRNNYIDHYCMTKDDGGAIYTEGREKSENNGRRLENNIIINGIGAGEGTDNPSYTAAEGIYMDDYTNNVTIINNSVANSSRGIFIHNSQKITIIGNTLYNNNSQLYFVHDLIAPTYPITQCIVKDNILFSVLKSQTVADFRTIDNGIPNFGTFDYNYYCRPLDDVTVINVEYTGPVGKISNFVNLSTWKSTFNLDQNSKNCPLKIAAYTIADLISPNKFSNSKFSTDIIGWDYWSDKSNGNAVWDNNSSLDQGCLKLSFKSFTGMPDAGLATFSRIGETKADKNYLLKFSLIAATENKIVKIVMRRFGIPYGNIAPDQFITVDTRRKDFELLFTPDLTETDSRVDFEIKEDVRSIGIDNVELYEVNIQNTRIEDSILFVYNPKNTNQTFNFDENYIDVRGNQYSGSITLLPYMSAVLIVDPNSTGPAANPVYVNSSIENAAPSILEMNYNLSLANIIPAASAFTVKVNSAERSINSVSVSGSKVLLTLSSLVTSGNTVTVSYTAPSSNPLQTSSGGKAASIVAQSVTNRVNPPASPIYVSSVIENSNPSVLEISYNLALANIVPDASAFSVKVNSSARSINSVSISELKVLLTLSSPVVNGNTVTVAYTAPSSNPLQTASGGKAVSINPQVVSNLVNPVSQPVAINFPPVVVVNYIQSNKSGFVSELNASGSYDSNQDNLTFSWKVPDNIPVSATNTSILQFLAPVINVSQKYEFILTVSDGKISQTKTVPVEIMPYQPGMEEAEVTSINASDFQSPFLPSNVLDGEIGTQWSAYGNNQWIILELKESFNIQHIKLAFQPGQKKEFYFDILGSVDKDRWEPILDKSNSCAFSGNLQVFEFPPSKTSIEYKYIKLVGQGNSADTWNYIAEFRIFGNNQRDLSEYENQIVKVYPNPASELVNIRIDKQTFVPDFIRIASLTGKIFFNDRIDPGVRQFQIPVNFGKGIYIIQMGLGDITIFTQKLIVIN